MSEIVVLVDYVRGDTNQGIIMDMGDDLQTIGEQLKIAKLTPPPGATFDGAFVLKLHDVQPDSPYIPDNAFGESLGLDGSAQLPMGKRWFTLVMKIEADAMEEEE